MKPKPKTKSKAFAAIHETVADLYQAKLISKETMLTFDEMCLIPDFEPSGDAIRELRLRENVSQSVFAKYMNVSKNLISDWEREVKKPGGPALRLLGVIEKHGLAILK